ncbi:MAG: SIS domain-containing protein [Propionibacteriaceae bacterium]|jgi:arabinose-5-phosphate isomerase|nr:SIS domain-containing protein [Propionibacteriaceae bacterium]
METADTAVLSAGRQVVATELSGLQSLVDNFDPAFAEVVNWLADCRGKVFVSGAGTSGAMAHRMAHLLSVCGTPALALQPADALHGTMGAVAAGDILIAISRGGKSAEINELCDRVRQRGAKAIALTSNPDSPLTRVVDLVVILPTDDQIDPGGVIAMGSTLVVGAWGDALATVLMRVRGYSWDEMLFTHPLGAVGEETHDLAPLDPLIA